MKKAFSKFIGLSVFVGMIFNSGAGVVNGLFGRSNENVGCYELKMEVSSLKEKNKKLEERIEKVEKEQKQTKEDLENHEKNKFHGYGFKDGGWWKNSASLLVAHLMVVPISVVVTVALGLLGVGIVK